MEGLLEVPSQQVSDFLIFKKKTQLSEEFKVPEDVNSAHVWEAFLEVHPSFDVQVLIVSQQPACVTLIQYLEEPRVLIYA